MTTGGQDPDMARPLSDGSRAHVGLPRRQRGPGWRWRARDLPLTVLALLVAALLLGHRAVPNVHGAGTMLDSALPWLVVALAPLAVAAAVVRSRWGGVALLVPALVWAGLFGPAFVPGKGGGGTQLRVVTQNLAADNRRPAGTARELVDSRADLVAVQEFTDPAAATVLDDAYPYHIRVGTVALWSRYPLRHTAPVDLGLGWDRALRAEVSTDVGAVTVYVVHLASVRPGADRRRDRMLVRLAGIVAADDSDRLLLLGDLNTASTDRQLDRLVPPLHDAQRAAGFGLGFTWPAVFPLVRPDQVLYRGMRATSAGVLHTTGSDHRAARAGFAFT